MKTRSVVTLVGLALTAPSAYAASNAGDASVEAMALYSRGSAVVQDSHRINLKRGEQTVAWPISGSLQPDTFWLSGDDVQLTGFSMSGQQGSSGGMLADRVGQKITITDARGKTRQGTLVDTQGDTAYVRVGDRIERITPGAAARISWPTPRNDDGAGITLNVTAKHAGKRKLTATYQTGAPSWQASYTGRFDPNSGRLELASRAVIDNTGHGPLKADTAWLVAGDTARADDGRPRPMMMATRASSESAAAGQPQAVGDVYRYPLTEGLQLAAGAVQSIALMPPIRVEAKRRYRFANYALSDTGEVRRHVRVSLSFRNTSNEPLPAGAVRVYDAGHAAHLMGGTRIDDTPTGAPVKLELGGAFDISGTHRITRQSTGNDRQTTQVTIDLFNAGDSARQVMVAERLPRHAQLADDTPGPDGGSANQPEWQVKVPAGGHEALSYRFTQPKSS